MPSFSERFSLLSESDRQAVISAQHPIYRARSHSWEVLLNAYEGSGGFLDGSYLWKFPREDSQRFIERRGQARYHNYAKALLNLYVRHVFQDGVDRQSEDQGLTEWWDDTDGAGTAIEDALKRATRLALASGHVGLLIDREAIDPDGLSLAEDRARVILSTFQATAIPDWRMQRGKLAAVKLLEERDNPDLLAKTEAVKAFLLWNDTHWARFSPKGELLEEGEHRLGRVPMAVIRPDPSSLHEFVGQPLLGDGKLFLALYNRASEEDVVLRDQAFSVLVVSVDKDADPAQVREEMGSEIGTTTALIVRGNARYETPDQSVPEGLRNNQQFLIREIHRLAHARFDTDTREAESAESLRLKHDELNAMLNGLARELERVEQDIARLYFAWTQPSPEAADRAYEAAQVTVKYPDEFFVAAIMDELEAWEKSIEIVDAPTYGQAVRRSLARSASVQLSDEELDAIDSEIESGPEAPPEPEPVAPGSAEFVPQGDGSLSEDSNAGE